MPAIALDDDSIWGLPDALIDRAFLDPDAFDPPEPLALLQAAAERAPDAVALTGHHEALRYRDMLHLIRNAAATITAAVPPGRPVACLLPRTPRAMAALLGCVVAGRICMVIDPALPPDRLAAMLTDAAPDAVLSPDPPPGLATHLPLATVLNGPGHDWHRDTGWDPDAPIAIYFTSGSSGQPKGIVIPGRMLMYRTLSPQSRWPLAPTDRFLAPAIPVQVAGLPDMLRALAVGARVVLADVSRDGVGATLRLADREGITSAVLHTPVMRALFAATQARHAFRNLHTLRMGGIALPRRDLLAWLPMLPAGCAVSHIYASTEAYIVAADDLRADDPDTAPTMAAGKLLPCHDVAIVDPAGHRVPLGEPGELVIRGRYLAAGEWIGGRFVPGRLHPVPLRPGWRIYRTGDFVRIQEDGRLRVLGRIDRQVKIHGNRVEPSEIEAALRSSPDIVDAAVIARTADDNVTLHAFVASPHPDRAALVSVLRQRLATRLPAWLRPATITVLDTLPALPSGKADHLALERHLEHDAQAPQSRG